MKFKSLCLVVLFLIAMLFTSRASTFEQFAAAINAVETGGRSGYILGDRGAAIGPLQIHHIYWADSRVGGEYKQCVDYKFSCKVMRGYLIRYARIAYERHDWETCARVHNGGPNGCKKKATAAYWKKVKQALEIQSEKVQDLRR